MSDIWVIAQIENDGSLKKATLNGLGAGKSLAGKTGGACKAVALGKHAEAVAGELKKYGVGVIAITGAGLDPCYTETWAQAVADLAKDRKPAFILGAQSVFTYDLLPRIAAKLDAGCVTNAIGFDIQGDKAVIQRPMFAANIIASVSITGPVKCAVIRGSNFPAAEPGGDGAVETVASTVDAGIAKKKLEKVEMGKSDKVELTEAQVVISGGRGLKEGANYKLLEDMAALFPSAAVGATRAMVDAGHAPNDMQVGQTGKTVAPQLYIAAGISGALQHIAGMKDSKVIVAINKDPDAPIFQVADYGIVDDLFKVVPELTTQLKAAIG